MKGHYAREYIIGILNKAEERGALHPNKRKLPILDSR